MSGFVPVRIDQFIEQYLRNNKDADGDSVRVAVDDALAAWHQGVRCACGKPLWVAGSAVAGYGCFSCITGSPEPEGDPEIDVVCDNFAYDIMDQRMRFEKVTEIMQNHPGDYRERLEAVGFVWQDDEYDLLFEEEYQEEQKAMPQSENEIRLIHFFENGGCVTQSILEAYLTERYSETANIPLVRKFFKRANPNLKAILLKGLAANPTNLDLLDDLAYFSEFDSILGELIHHYTDACRLETDMEKFSMLAQDFHLNTYDQGYDALYELSSIFPSGTKGAVVKHLCNTIEEDHGEKDISF